ncbi:5-deoxy-glucuronate isomerase [Aliidongia dinghuensis]|uniref:5-deoxy-glucuronate isomerase n=1 Tax=Aliidongia dinghuensis TaxID=1867774 RepID=A0A8J2YV47_9PROT|nr:5-deoxy-glucuronate isomerase [Aliidongia dinghuensis]GGF25562.1 5-deoxy-glucuronate isomerase [Aliidongia dinghuensis]
MSDLHLKPSPPDGDGRVLAITPASAGWRYVGFELFKLAPGRVLERETGDREACLVLVAGRATVEVGQAVFKGIGERRSPFDGKPHSVYAPAGTAFRVTAETPLELAVCTAPGSGALPPRLIPPEAVAVEERGQGTNRRIVHNILPEEAPAESLLVVEVLTPGGHWSSYPPHKHDRDAFPEETLLEETYYHRLNPAQGFALQRVYTDDRSLDQTFAVGDGDCVLVPRGYHPVGAPHGYDLYYLNTMAGPRRQWRFRNDPAHDWITRRPND